MCEEKCRSDSFEDVAKDLGCDESYDALDKAMDSVQIKQETEKKDAPDDKK